MVWTLLWTWNLPESAFTARCGTRDQPKTGPQNCAKGGGEGYSAMASHLALKLVCVWTITCLGSGHDVHRAPLLHDRWTCIDNEIPSRMGSLAVQRFHKRSFPSEHLKISICRWFRMISTDFHEYLKCQGCQGTDLSDCSAMASALPLPWSWDASCASTPICPNDLSQAPAHASAGEARMDQAPKNSEASAGFLEWFLEWHQWNEMMPSATQSHGFVWATSSPHPRPAKCVNKTCHATSPLNRSTVICFSCIYFYIIVSNTATCLDPIITHPNAPRVLRVFWAWCPLWCILPCLAILGRSAKLCHKRHDPKHQGALELQGPPRLRSLASKCFAICQNVITKV